MLVALRTKGETVDELVGLATTMRALRHAGARPSRDDLIDTAGTGGGRPTFNVSTTAALIAAGAGCAVAKHGNRSATGLSRLGRRARGARRAHRPRRPTRSRAASTRSASASCSRPPTTAPRASSSRCARSSRVRTIFNFLGPLTNPAGATRQVIGVSDPAFLETIAGALARLGAAKALVVSSDDGLDEMSTSGDNARRRGRRRPRSRATTVAPGGRRAAPRPPRATSPAARPSDNAADDARASSPASPARARPGGAQRRRGDLRGGPRRHARGGRARRRGGDRRRRAAAARSSGSSR